MKLTFYHITCAENVSRILRDGLLPHQPDISTVQAPMVYLHQTIGGLLNLRQQQVDEGNKPPGAYALLSVRVRKEILQPDPDTDADAWMTDQPICSRDIRVEFYGELI